MLNKIKTWLDKNDYPYRIIKNHYLGIARVEVCYDDMRPLKIAKFLMQLDEWLAEGCIHVGFTVVKGKPHCVFTAPLPAIYSLLCTVDRRPSGEIVKSSDVNKIRGIMLNNYIHSRESFKSIVRSVINLDDAEIVFDDSAGNRRLLIWHIHRTIMEDAQDEKPN